MVTKAQIAAVVKGTPKGPFKPAVEKKCKHIAKKPTAAKKLQKAGDHNVHNKKPVRKKKASTGTTIRIDRGRFCQELVKNSMNATKAYLAVSPKVTAKTAATEGGRLLREPDVIKILTPMLAKLFVDAGIEADYVFRRWLEIAEGSAADYFTFDAGVPRLDMSDMSPAQLRNLKSIGITHGKFGTNYKIEVYCADHAVDMIAKHLGLLVEKLAEEDVERIGDLIEQGVARIRATKDLDGWKSIVFDAEAEEVRR